MEPVAVDKELSLILLAKAETPNDRIPARTAAAAGALSSKQFAAIIQKADIKDRQLYIKPRSIGASSMMFINFYNIPKAIGGGADNENNRQMYVVSGFDKQDEDVPADKVKLEISVNALGKDKAFSLLAASGTFSNALTTL